MDCSIVMITRAVHPKRLALLQHTIASLRKRTHYPYELVVVDNGPSEQTDWLRTQDIDMHIINRVNLGMGRPRAQGAAASEGKYLVFCDNDLQFQDNWLTESIELLERYEDKKIIVTPLATIPMRKIRHSTGELDGHTLWPKAGSGCLVFRRKDYERIGPFQALAEAGREYGQRVVKNGYAYLLMKEPKVKHVGRARTWRRRCVCVNGEWIKESKTCQLS